MPNSLSGTQGSNPVGNQQFDRGEERGLETLLLRICSIQKLELHQLQLPFRNPECRLANSRDGALRTALNMLPRCLLVQAHSVHSASELL
jgi:hypothetical protein